VVRKDYLIPDVLWEEIASFIPTVQTEETSARTPSIESFRSKCHGCHPLRPEDRLPVERPQQDRHLFFKFGPSEISGMGEKGVFKKIWQHTLEQYDEMKGIDWSFCSTDGAMTKAPLGGEKNRKESHQ
jgi:hypothetical protein